MAYPIMGYYTTQWWEWTKSSGYHYKRDNDLNAWWGASGCFWMLVKFHFLMWLSRAVQKPCELALRCTPMICALSLFVVSQLMFYCFKKFARLLYGESHWKDVMSQEHRKGYVGFAG